MHPCDNCYRCRRDRRCCRKDDPTYTLPAFGSWDGRVYGRLGALATDGKRLQCHACGRWFRAIGTHLVRIHNIDADAYRALFGLRAATGLVGPPYRERLRGTAEKNFRPYWPSPGDRPAELIGKTRRLGLPLESKLDPINQRRWAEHGRRLAERERQAWAAGERQPPRPRDPAGSIAKAVARWRELMQDPVYRAAHHQKIVKSAEPRLRHFTCQACGTEFVRTKTWFGTRACGPACAAQLRGRAARTVRPSQRPEVRGRIREAVRRRGSRGAGYQQIVERLRTLPDEAFARLPERTREVVRLYYGLDHDAPWTQAAIADRLGVRRETVRDLLSSHLVKRRLGLEAPQGLRLVRHRALAVRLRALPVGALEVLPNRDRALLELYYGLGDRAVIRPGEAPTMAELAERFSLQTPGHVSRRLRKSVGRLLGRDAMPAERQRLIVCDVCGARFQRRAASAPAAGSQHACSTACLAELRRRNTQRVAQRRGRPDREALLALPPAALERVPEPERTLLRRYYGLGQDPERLRDLTRELHMDPRRLRALVDRGVQHMFPLSGGPGPRSDASHRLRP